MLKMTIERRKARDGMIFVAPWVFGAVFLFIFPVVNSFMQSVNDPSKLGLFEFRFYGFSHYMNAWNDSTFLSNFISTLTSTLTNLPLVVIFSFFIAILINRKILFRAFFREIFFMPVLLGTGFVMQQLLNRNLDTEALAMAKAVLMPEELMLYLGPDISNGIDAFLSSIVVVMWSTGVQILLFLSGLQGISGSLYESAYVDGATEWEKFWKITLPLMAPTILLIIVYTLVDSFTNISNGMLNYIRDVMLRNSDFKYSAAMGWLYFLFIFVLIGLVFLIMRPFIRRVSNR